MKHKAVFVDRDGTLIYDEHYLSDPRRVRLIPGCASALLRLQQAGLHVVSISNQSGVARGLLTLDDVEAVNARVRDLLLAEGVLVVGQYVCPHGPDANCACRKPKPGMIRQAAEEHDLDVRQSYVIGDKYSDALAGSAAGCKTVFLRTTGANPQPGKAAEADFCAQSWGEVAAWILG